MIDLGLLFSGRKMRILIVDDEEVLRHMVARVLKSMGIESDTAEDGLDAISKINKDEFEIVIADIRMPNMDGIQLLKHIKREYQSIDVLIMTAHTSQHSFTDVIEGGAIDFIMKPFSVEELKAKVGRVLRERKNLEELGRKTAQLESAYAELLSLKDEEEKTCRDINYEKEFLVGELKKLKTENAVLHKKVKGLES